MVDGSTTETKPNRGRVRTDLAVEETVAGVRGGFAERFGVATAERLLKVMTFVGFAALFGAICVAHLSPADGYETSIYASTPLSFWLLWGLVVATAFTTCAYAPRTRFGLTGLSLGGLAAFMIPALPILRGYQFMGTHDSLTHLGFVRGIIAEQVSTWELLYPVSHTVSVLLSRLGGAEPTHTMMLTVMAFVVLYLVGVPMVVRALVDDQRAFVIAGFGAFMLLPVNTISTYAYFHPFSLATFCFPLVLYPVVTYLVGRFDDPLVGPVTVSDVLVTLTGVGLVVLHPLAAVNYIILLGVVAAARSKLGSFHAVSLGSARRLFGYAVVVTVFFLLWNLAHYQLYAYAQETTTALFDALAGQAQVAEVASRQTAASKRAQVGFTIPELFGKLFLVEAIFGLLSAALVGRVLLDRGGKRTGLDPTAQTVVLYLTVGGVALLPFFLLQFVGSVSGYFFRHVGFGMALATILGSIGLYSLLTSPPRIPLREYLRPVVVVVAVLMLVLSMATVFSSPFIYKPTKHADAQQMQGWETSFAEQPPRVGATDEARIWYTTANTPKSRYEDAFAHTPGTPWYPGQVVPDPNSAGTVNASEIEGGLVDHAETMPNENARRDLYLPLSRMTVQRETVAYNELNYERETFRSIQLQEGVHRVRDNGGYRVYYIDVPDSEPMEDYPDPAPTLQPAEETANETSATTA